MIRFLGRPAKRLWRRLKLRNAKKVIIGAAKTSQPGWVASDVDILDITKPNNFSQYWKANTIVAFLAEHVWEHLSEHDGRLALENCHEYLAPGGHIRIAVPDGNSPDIGYINSVRPGGSGPGADDHKVLYNVASLCKLLAETGYKPLPLEFFDEDGSFERHPWKSQDGHVSRSFEHDVRNHGKTIGYTSLIVDGFKPPSLPPPLLRAIAAPR